MPFDVHVASDVSESCHHVDDRLVWGPTEGACTVAVPAMTTRPRTSVLRMLSTHPANRNANHR